MNDEKIKQIESTTPPTEQNETNKLNIWKVVYKRHEKFSIEEKDPTFLTIEPLTQTHIDHVGDLHNYKVVEKKYNNIKINK